MLRCDTRKIKRLTSVQSITCSYNVLGPSFGSDSLVIPFNKDNPKMARSKLGSYYERFEDGTNSLFGKGRASVLLKDLKVYHGVYEEGEYIPFTDAEPFALY